MAALNSRPSITRRYLAALNWLPADQHDWFVPDVMAGLAVWAVMVREGMAYWRRRIVIDPCQCSHRQLHYTVLVLGRSMGCCPMGRAIVGETSMFSKCLLIAGGIPLLSVWGCAPVPPPQPAAAVQVTPTTTTSAYDGSYVNPVITAKTATCPNLPPMPSLTISNGLGVWPVPNVAYQGYVTPQGVLTMNSNTGQTFQGQIDQTRVLRGHAAGPNCAYDVSFVPMT
jgi:hypothetical protein